MSNPLVLEELLAMRKENKFTQPLSVYYPGLNNEYVRCTLSNILDNGIIEISQRVSIGNLLKHELKEIINKGMELYRCFPLSDDDWQTAKSYYDRLQAICGCKQAIVD